MSPRLKPPSKEEGSVLPAFSVLPTHAIHIPATPEAFDKARAALLAQTVLGFDTESKPLFRVGEVDHGPHIVQLASTQEAWILQLHHREAVALAAEILASSTICKIGFGLQHDKAVLPKRLGVQLNHIVDLDAVFKRHGYIASVGVRGAVALVLGQHFQKSKRQSTSNWAKIHLNEMQVRYAVNDAHAPAMVYEALPAWEASLG